MYLSLQKESYLQVLLSKCRLKNSLCITNIMKMHFLRAAQASSEILRDEPIFFSFILGKSNVLTCLLSLCESDLFSFGD